MKELDVTSSVVAGLIAMFAIVLYDYFVNEQFSALHAGLGFALGVGVQTGVRVTGVSLEDPLHYISNPFQVLGKSDPQESVVPVEKSSDSDVTAAPVELSGIHGGKGPMVHVPIPASEIGAANPEVVNAEKAQGITPPAPKHLTFLHHLGTFFKELGKFSENDLLPIAIQVGLPILERKL